MDTNALKRFAQNARQQLIAQVSTRVDQVLETDSALLREQESAINSLKAEIQKRGKEAVIEEAAYTWFNRFCAFRFMDVNHYTPFGIVSPMPGFTQPEILQHAKEGIFEKGWHNQSNQMISGLLNRSIPSPDGDQEAYRLLLADACRHYANEMAFLFDDILDFTELLMPDDLLSSHSVLHATRQTLTAETCQDVEVIGWLYQFYISEKKDAVMAQKGAVAKEDIPSVTQLFTPDWIVRYMVENSLGRLWLLNNPGSKIREKMPYYIQPGQVEKDYLVVESPEDLKLLDPACGSGHILTYAFDLLYEIYAEQGYDPIQIPWMIIEKNLYGIEIDKRAAMLASFALMMKARQKDARFFRRKVRPNILEMEDIHFDTDELKAWRTELGDDLWTQELWEGMQQFENAKTFGSLIRPAITEVSLIRQRMAETAVYSDLFLSEASRKVEKVLEMSEYLSQRYHVVVANPPYMGGNKFDSKIKTFANSEFPQSKSDLFAMFIERGFELIKSNGYNTMVTMQSWMFLSSYEAMREEMFKNATIITMVHMANMVMGIAFGTVATIWKKSVDEGFNGSFSYVDYSDLDEENKPREFPIQNKRLSIASAQDFKKIPGSPIAYWINKDIFRMFKNYGCIGDYFTFQIGLVTGNNTYYTRYWFEVDNSRIGFNLLTREDSAKSEKKWFPYAKGGDFRKWSGNSLEIINWENDGYELQNTLDPTGKRIWAHNFNLDKIFKPSVSWNSITSSENSYRFFPAGYLFDSAGGLCQPNKTLDLSSALSYLNSVVASYILPIINPTINNPPGYIAKLPFSGQEIFSKTLELIKIAEKDWGSYETSWHFGQFPLLEIVDEDQGKLMSAVFSQLRKKWHSFVKTLKKLEEENNEVQIDHYGLQYVLEPEVPVEDITLTCNPHYRYRGNYTDEEREARLLQDTMKEFISYAVGCMFGRYALDKPGLILANQGESLKDYLKIIDKEPTFMPTENNVIPMLDDDYFADDITPRFRDFLKVTFGETNFDENLRFIESALGKDLRSYFLRDFYRDHLQTYKKRPIYWLFSSAKGGFKALIYMHRYQPDTVSVVLNHYLREYRQKLEAKRDYHEKDKENADLSKSERRRAEKESERIRLVLEELRDYEHDVLFPLAGKRLEIDLDDGVVVNHAKFGKALQKIR